MQDVIFIQNLQLLASIGVFEWEKQLLQKLQLDVELLTDIRPAAASERLDQTLDYAAISQRLMQLAQSRHHDLIETLAESMAQCLLTEFNTPQVTLTLRKPGAVAAADTVGVRICRQRPEATSD
jgi:7,8-dihydroneopterin aldolase/epimerase/oxygenase